MYIECKLRYSLKFSYGTIVIFAGVFSIIMKVLVTDAAVPTRTQYLKLPYYDTNTSFDAITVKQ